MPLYPEDPATVAYSHEPRSLRVPSEPIPAGQSIGVGVPMIPARLNGINGIDVSSSGRQYTIGLDIASLPVAPGLPPQQWLAAWVEGTPVDAIARVAVNAIPADAPANGIVYGRKDHAWFDIGSLEIPWDNVTGKPATFPPSPHTHPMSDIIGLTTEIAQINDTNEAQDISIAALELAASTAIGDAPVDGSLYGRKDQLWEVVELSGTVEITDTPPLTAFDATFWWESDTGFLFLRYPNAGDPVWVQVNGFQDAPPDDILYGRKNGAWVEFVADIGVSWTDITGKPTTLVGFGITDAYTKAQVDTALAGKADDADISGLATLASPTFTGDPKAPTPATADNDTSIATSAFVKAQGYLTSALAASTFAPLSHSQAATTISFTPAGNVAAVTVQTAIQELDGEKLALTGGTLTGNLAISKASPTFALNKAASGQDASFYGQTNGLTRWSFNFATSVAESGSNAGSNFAVGRYNDAGAYIDTPFEINRATGVANFTAAPTVLGTPISGGGGTPGGATTQIQFNDAGAFGGDAQLTYAKATDVLTLTGQLAINMGDAVSVLAAGLIRASSYECAGAIAQLAPVSSGLVILRGAGAGSNTGQVAISATETTFTARVDTVASTTGSAGIRLPHGVDPTGPVNGDLWSTTAGFYGRVNGATVGPFGAGGGGGQPLDATLTALAGLNTTAGLVEQTGTDTFTKRLIGVANATDIPTRANGDARWQTLDTDLTAIAALTSASNQLPYATGAGTWTLTTLSAYGRTLIDDADASAAQSTLGISTFVKTLLDDADVGTAQSTLGISTFVKTILDDADASTVQSTLGISTFAKTILDDADAAAVQSTIGISTFVKTILDDADAAAVRATIGVGSMATRAITVSTSDPSGGADGDVWFKV